ncbi:hypothetical protein EJ06DRAFT_349372 [Trichodelitschia bisporula]|uniref:S-adenosyl-L-methionine-dependent methyltransferase n=1 Tax=Trichodelitschia bisporula TaxID=703511 RepID=A0A6G1I0H2_9PEZI|nr:hypothetical protein EJ06DRAFT_349372 [Trichodelitschia bisporula]
MPHAVSEEPGTGGVAHGGCDCRLLTTADRAVFDLPQLYTKPPAKQLLQALSQLSRAPPSWTDGDDKRDEDATGIAQYLTGIVANGLRWISDEEREEVWEHASRALAARSGRSAMSAMTRSFRIPVRDGAVDLLIHEPALTEDNLGFKTWAASYLLAKRLHIDGIVVESGRMLELGAGTGLVGIAAGAVFGAEVVLSDLPEIVGNLAQNVATNATVVEARGGSVSAAVLDWRDPKVLVGHGEERVGQTELFPVILAADSIYTPEHPALLARAVATWLAPTAGARVLVELPLRLGFEAERLAFREEMRGRGLALLDEGEEEGRDDWGNGGVVTCWYSVWGWVTLVEDTSN